MQDNKDVMPASDRPANNTWAKSQMQTISQDFAPVVSEQATTTPIHTMIQTTEYIGAILDKETGVCMEYQHLMKHPKYKSPGDTYTAMK